MSMRPSLQSIRDTARAISPYIRRTPVLTRTVAGRTVHFKAELLQNTGAFKFRGACSAVLQAKAENPALPGVVTHSSGNHGIGLASVARQLDVPVAIVVPSSSPPKKRQLIESHGAELVVSEPTPAAREVACAQLVAERGYLYIPSSKSHDVIAGQATIGVEILEDFPDVDAIIAPSSGGALVTGVALAARYLKPNCRIFAAVPQGSLLEESLAVGEARWDPNAFRTTKCDALRMPPEREMFEIMLDVLDRQVFTVTDEEAVAAMRWCWEELKLCCELSSAVTIAALRDLPEPIREVAVIISGGNCDLATLPWVVDAF